MANYSCKKILSPFKPQYIRYRRIDRHTDDNHNKLTTARPLAYLSTVG